MNLARVTKLCEIGGAQKTAQRTTLSFQF